VVVQAVLEAELLLLTLLELLLRIKVAVAVLEETLLVHYLVLLVALV
jgi:hypothetical protein